MHSDMPLHERTFAHRTALRIVAGVMLLASVTPAFGAPIVQQVNSALDHGGSVTVSGSGFGSKPSAAPVVWDNSAGSSMSAKWDGALPNALPGYNTQYYTPMRGINPPHSHATRYIAGAHAAKTGANSGYDVVFYKNVTLQSSSSYIYVSWYQRSDDAWVFGGDTPGTLAVPNDNNYKTFVYSVCCGPYQQPYWYTMLGPPHPSSNTDSSVVWAINGPVLNNPDLNGHSAWWDKAVNPMAGKWSKVEMAMKVSSQNDGYVTQWENGRQVIHYVGPTDNFPGTKRTVAIGGYARQQGYPSNWRYFDDVYLDTTLARVVLADKPVLSQATIVENQIPSAWSDGSITATVNLGQFTQGQTAYLFVVDASGTPSASGLAVVAGGTTEVPDAPPAVSVK
jgi:hypothetical protein